MKNTYPVWSDEQNPWDYDLKRFDGGFTIGGGVQIKSFEAELSYNYGLANISSVTTYRYTMTNRVLAVSVGYKFGRQE